ncbi:hypothetical protein HDV05_006548 [Chytridiales sp. JEL 0842]|nr:hypothetical protein HDV05_006548 [Chytridiales sp. JEL 0842]
MEFLRPSSHSYTTLPPTSPNDNLPTTSLTGSQNPHKKGRKQGWNIKSVLIYAFSICAFVGLIAIVVYRQNKSPTQIQSVSDASTNTDDGSPKKAPAAVAEEGTVNPPPSAPAAAPPKTGEDGEMHILPVGGVKDSPKQEDNNKEPAPPAGVAPQANAPSTEDDPEDEEDPGTPASSSSSSDSDSETTPIFPPLDLNSIAVGVHSRLSTVPSRELPIMLKTSLKGVQNLLVFADPESIQIEGVKVVNVDEGSEGLEKSKARKRQAVMENANAGDDEEEEGAVSGDGAEADGTEGDDLGKNAKVNNGTASEGEIIEQPNLPTILPYLRTLSTTYPTASFYLLLVDSTYTFTSNLLNLLSNFDPADTIYLGSPTWFQGCGGVEGMGEGPSFASASGGIIVSQGAVKKVLEGGVEKCMEKYKDCNVGDIQLALCLADQNIKLMDRFDIFHTDALDLKSSWPSDSCGEPLVVNGWSVETMEKLVKYTESLQSTREADDEDPEAKREAQSLNYGDLFNFMASEAFASAEAKQTGKGTLESNTLRHASVGSGGELKVVDKSPKPEACENECAKLDRCVAWTWFAEKCSLMDGIVFAVELEGATSGVLFDKYSCSV